MERPDVLAPRSPRFDAPLVPGPERTLGISADIDAAVARLTHQLRDRAHDLGATIDVDPRSILRARAHLLGFADPSHTSANGHSRLIRCRDEWIALSLARRDDVDVLEALIEQPVDDDPWACVTRAAHDAASSRFVARGRLLGLPIALVARGDIRATAPIELRRRAPSSDRAALRGLVVADLSSLWAGPLTAKILADAGAEVTKIESATRPDGARARPEFYTTLHEPDQRSVVVDFAQARDRDRLRDILAAADVVIEGSRPRALEQLGLGPEQLDSRAGAVWLSVTGYGRRPPGDGWVAFGDDGAAAGGLVTWSKDDEPSFVGDAIADPLTGLFGALGVVESMLLGGGHLVDVSLQRSSAWIAAKTAAPFVDVQTE